MGQLDAASPQGPQPVEYLDPGGHCDEHCGDREHRVGDGAKTHGEHVVAPHSPAHDADDDAGEDHERVAEQRLLGEGRQYLRHYPHGRQDEDIHLGVAEHPEQVLPQDRVSTPGRDEEVRAEVAVHQQLDQANGDDRHCEDQQE